MATLEVFFLFPVFFFFVAAIESEDFRSVDITASQNDVRNQLTEIIVKQPTLDRRKLKELEEIPKTLNTLNQIYRQNVNDDSLSVEWNSYRNNPGDSIDKHPLDIVINTYQLEKYSKMKKLQNDYFIQNAILIPKNIPYRKDTIFYNPRNLSKTQEIDGIDKALKSFVHNVSKRSGDQYRDQDGSKMASITGAGDIHTGSVEPLVYLDMDGAGYLSPIQSLRNQRIYRDMKGSYNQFLKWPRTNNEINAHKSIYFPLIVSYKCLPPYMWLPNVQSYEIILQPYISAINWSEFVAYIKFVSCLVPQMGKYQWRDVSAHRTTGYPQNLMPSYRKMHDDAWFPKLVPGIYRECLDWDGVSPPKLRVQCRKYETFYRPCINNTKWNKIIAILDFHDCLVGYQLYYAQYGMYFPLK